MIQTYLGIQMPLDLQIKNECVLVWIIKDQSFVFM